MNTSQQKIQSKQHPQSQFRLHASQQQTHPQISQAVNTSNSVNPVIPITPIPATAPTVVLFPISQSTSQLAGQTSLSGTPTSSIVPTPVVPVISPDSQADFLLDNEPPLKRRHSFPKIIAIVLVLAIVIYFIWQPAPTTLSSSTTNIQNTNSSGGSNGSSGSANTGSANDTTGDIQVYVLGAVKTPGLYTLPPGTRVFDLIKAAGGTLPNANLVALNMAAKLTDGEEVYVTLVGETPPAYSGGVPGLSGGNGSSGSGGNGGSNGTSGATSGTGGTGTTGTLVNINTASETELMQSLHVSSRTAQSIVNYRTQNGNYTSVDQLLQVISKAIYDRIRAQCTV